VLAFELQYHLAYPSISDPGDLIAARLGAAASAAARSARRTGRPIADLSQERIKLRPVLGSLLNEYEQAG
jgi:hypothetical protein